MSASRHAVANGGAPSRSLATRAQSLPPIVGWLAFVLLAIAIVVLRRPESLTNAAFFYEDGQVFYIGAFFGSPLDQLTRQYEGYLHLIPRLVAMLERLVPPASAPLIGNAIALLVVVGVAAYIASGRLENVIPGRRTRVLLAIVFLLLPGA